MSSIIDRLRSGAGKAAFEADKLRRVAAVQSAIKSLKEEVNKSFYQVGHVAYTLHTQGQVTQPELKEACDRLAALQTQIAAHEREIESIRAEEYVEPVSQSTTQYGRVCPNGHGPIPLPNNFCQTCGAQAVDIPPPASAGAVLCQNCNSPLLDEARFCANCGQPAPEPAAAASSACHNCGATLLPESLFCAECGSPISAEEPSSLSRSDEPASPPEDKTEPAAPSLLDEDAATVSAFPDFVAFPDSAVEGDEEAVVESDQTDEGWPAADAPEGDDESGSEMEERPEEVVSVETEQTGVCPACDSPLLPEALFCAECGHRIVNDE